jgi:hypothetical protein
MFFTGPSPSAAVHPPFDLRQVRPAVAVERLLPSSYRVLKRTMPPNTLHEVAYALANRTCRDSINACFSMASGNDGQ